MPEWTKELDATMDQVRDVVAARIGAAIREGVAIGTHATFAQLAACVAAAEPVIDAEFLLIDVNEPKPTPKRRKKS